MPSKTRQILQAAVDGWNSAGEAPSVNQPVKKTGDKPPKKTPSLNQNQEPKRDVPKVKMQVRVSQDVVVVREPFRIIKATLLTGAIITAGWFVLPMLKDESEKVVVAFIAGTLSFLFVMSALFLRSQFKGTVVDFENDLISFSSLVFFRRSIKLSDITGISYTEPMFKRSANSTNGLLLDLIVVKNPRVIKLVGPKFGSRKLTYASESKSDQVYSILTA